MSDTDNGFEPDDDALAHESGAGGRVPPVAASSRIEFRALLLVGLMLVLMLASVAYIMYARGVFDRTQRLLLVTDDSEGIAVGMDMTFAGFPIGEVRNVSLAPDGNVLIDISVKQKNAHWLRSSSVFTVERGIVGGTRIRAFSGVMEDPPLEDGARRTVLRGDATAEIPRLMASAREVLGNVQALTAAEGSLGQSLANVEAITSRLKGPKGAMGALLGEGGDDKKLSTALDRVNALLLKLDGIAGKADRQVFGDKGVMDETRAALVQLNGALADARATLKKVDAVLVEAQGIAANTREASADLGTLRAEIDTSLRKVDQMIGELNRKWPFARPDGEVKLP